MHPSLIIERFLRDDDIPVPLTEALLLAIHRELKHAAAEEVFWRKLNLLYHDPLPPSIAFDLIDRNVAVVELGHSRQEMNVMWALAGKIDEALLTLAIDIYVKPAFGMEDAERLFAGYDHHAWMLETLIRQEPSSPGKRTLLEAALQRNAHADVLLRLLASRDNGNHAKRDDLPAESYYDLFRTNDSHVWLSLSQNPNTPEELLQRLLKAKDISNARLIRESARLNLGRRER
ncbi:hypothetical protein [Paenibacillus methanolicus]|uniref:HEAT repeat protein n=1 Tax=Paenibacillus methanolicus TaxID=582686 RepID=A0A5S5BV09_9BACL|nr:hypothetical protein [Paenibacillus methanolicus]TYP69423.1 hypothetical protein BCM02_11584 [Paenibacillus methanolicus]